MEVQTLQATVLYLNPETTKPIQEGRHGGPDWDGGSRPRMFHGLLYNLCTTITSCFYVFCCCWMIEDCFMGRRSFHGHSYGSPDFPPPPVVGPGPPRALGSVFGPPGPPPGQPGPVGYPGAPPPF